MMDIVFQLQAHLTTVLNGLSFLADKFTTNGDQNVQEFVKNVLQDTILTRTSNVNFSQLVVLQLISMETVLNARLVTNMIQITIVSFLFQIQMIIVPNTHLLIQLVHGMISKSEVAKRSVSNVIVDIN